MGIISITNTIRMTHDKKGKESTRLVVLFLFRLVMFWSGLVGCLVGRLLIYIAILFVPIVLLTFEEKKRLRHYNPPLFNGISPLDQVFINKW